MFTKPEYLEGENAYILMIKRMQRRMLRNSILFQFSKYIGSGIETIYAGWYEKDDAYSGFSVGEFGFIKVCEGV